MRKAMFGVFAAMLAVVAFGGTASADPGDTVRISPAGAISAVAAGTLTLGGLINCNPVTITGNLLAGPIAQTTTGPITVGSITGASASNCGFLNSVTFLNLSQWRITASLTGLVRNASGVVSSVQLTIANVQVQVRVLAGAATCLYTGSPVGTYTPANDTLRFVAQPLRLVSGGGACPSPGNLDGTMRISPRQAITVI